MKKDKYDSLIESKPDYGEILLQADQSDRSEWNWEDYVTFGQMASEVKSYSQWLIGKLASEVFNKWGKDEKYASEIHISVGSLQQYRRVYIQLSKQGYVPNGFFPWGVLQIAANYNPGESAKTLEELEDNGIATIEGAYRYIKEKKTGIVVPRKPSLRLIWNQDVNKWKVVLKPEDIPEIDWSDVKKQLLDYLSNL